MVTPATFGLTLDGSDADPAAAAARRERDWTQLQADLVDSAERACAWLDGRPDGDGDRASACADWTVAQVVAHVADGDDLAAAALAGSAPADWVRRLQGAPPQERDRAIADGIGLVSGRLPELTARWRRSRAALVEAMSRFEGDARYERIEWVGPPIARITLAQSRVMEAWIHLWDVRAGTGEDHVVTDDAWWVADLAVRTIPWALQRDGLPVDLGLHLHLEGPAGGTWQRTIGPGHDPVVVAGPAWVFLALASRRVQPDEAVAALTIEGSSAARRKIATTRAFV